MRTAEEILQSGIKQLMSSYPNLYSATLLETLAMPEYKMVLSAMRDYAIEVINEYGKPVCHVVEGQCGFDKKLILDLIKEVK